MIEGENGEPCSNSTSHHLCWKRHFTTVLNIQSQHDATAMEKIKQREVNEDLGSVSTAKG